MSSPSTRWQHAALILGILLVATNLRPAVTALSPLAERMFQDGLSREAIGILTTIPLLLFGMVGLWAGWIGGRLGLARALGLGLLLIAAGCLVRSAPGEDAGFWRLGGTVLIGAGIAVGNVILPGLVKSRYPQHLGILTSLYSTAMNVGAAFGLALAVPLANALPGGWNASLASWAVLALVSFALWVPQMRPAPTVYRPARPLSGVAALAKQRRAWEMAAFMGLQSMVFYAAVAWLPTVLQYRGLSEGGAAGWVSATQALGCLASLTVPALAARARSQSAWAAGCALLNALSLAGVLLLPAEWVGLAVIGFGLGANASFGLVLFLIAARSATPATAASLSALAQAAGYLLAAPGPWLVGWLSTTAGGWNLAFSCIVVMALLAALAGTYAGRPGELRLPDEPVTP